MLKTVDLFKVSNQYSSTHLFLEQLQRAFEKLDIRCRIIDFEDGYFRDYLDLIVEDPPELTCSFAYLNPERPTSPLLCDMLQKPHLIYGLDNVFNGLFHLNSPFGYLSTVDTKEWELLQTHPGAAKTLFLPHAVESRIEEWEEEKKYDLLFTSTYIDFEEEKRSWSSKFLPEVCKLMEWASEQILQGSLEPLIVILDKAQNEFSLQMPSHTLLGAYFSVENYCKGRDRLELIRALKDFKVHLFGSQQKGKDWRKATADLPNVVYHAPVSYQESIELFKKSKIVLNSSPQFRYGSHERVFTGLSMGAAVITGENPYLEKQLSASHGVLYYANKHDNWDQLKAQIAELLANEQRRKERVEFGRSHVLKEHTWEERVRQMQEFFTKAWEHR